MTQNGTPACPDCNSAYEIDDNYCRKCGMYLAAMRPAQLTAAGSRALEPVRSAGLPAPVRKAATALAIGTALQIGVGLAGKYIASQGAKQTAVSAAKPLARRGGRKGQAAKRGDAVVRDPLEDAAAISETVMVRRVWVRRG